MIILIKLSKKKNKQENIHMIIREEFYQFRYLKQANYHHFSIQLISQFMKKASKIIKSFNKNIIIIIKIYWVKK